MENPFSFLEMQLVKSSLLTRSDDEIAGILERPVDEVISVINELMGGQADQRMMDVGKYKEEQIRLHTKPKKEKTAKQQDRDWLDSKKRERDKKRAKEAIKETQRQKEVAGRSINRKYKTRDIDWKKKMSVKLDDKTYAFVDIMPTAQEQKILNEKVKLDYELLKRKRAYLPKEES